MTGSLHLRSHARSLSLTNITNDGKDMSAVIKLAEALPQTSITSLKCAACERCA